MENYEERFADFISSVNIKNMDSLLNNLEKSSLIEQNKLAILRSAKNPRPLLTCYLVAKVNSIHDIHQLVACLRDSDDSDIANELQKLKLFADPEEGETIESPISNKPLLDCSEDELASRMIILDDSLGKGGYGYVFKAKDKSTGDEYAVKLLDMEVSDLKYINRERKILRMFSKTPSPNVVNYYGHWIEKDKSKLPKDYVQNQRPSETLCLIIELCDTSLENWYQEEILNDKKLLPHAAKFFSQVVEGVIVLHEERVTHRDLKPGNILIKGGTAKITDFGFSRLIRPNASSVLSHGLGTDWYMSPEQRSNSGEYTEKTDVYALGKILRELYCPMTSDEIKKGRSGTALYQKRLESDAQWKLFFKTSPKIALMVQSMLCLETTRMDVTKLGKLTKWHIHPKSPTSQTSMLTNDSFNVIMPPSFDRLEFEVVRLLDYKQLTRFLLSNVVVVPYQLLAALDGQQNLLEISIENCLLSGVFDPQEKLYTPKLKKFKCHFLYSNQLAVPISIGALMFVTLEKDRRDINFFMNYLDELEVAFNGIAYVKASKTGRNLELFLHEDFDYVRQIASISHDEKLTSLHIVEPRPRGKMIELSNIIGNLTALKELILQNVRMSNVNLAKMQSLEHLFLEFAEMATINLKHLSSTNLKHVFLINARVQADQSCNPIQALSLSFINCDISEDGLVDLFTFEELFVQCDVLKLKPQHLDKFLDCANARVVLLRTDQTEIFEKCKKVDAITRPVVHFVYFYKSQQDKWLSELVADQDF